LKAINNHLRSRAETPIPFQCIRLHELERGEPNKRKRRTNNNKKKKMKKKMKKKRRSRKKKKKKKK